MSGYYTSSRESNSFQNSDHDGHSNLIRKNFYKEHPNVAKLSQMEVEKIRNDLGITIVGQNIPNPVTSFNEAGFPSSLIQTILNDPKFSCPTPIQSQGISYLAWPLALSGKDFIGIAQTGSGKTLAFVLPALVHICDQSPLSSGDGPIALVLSPTRELAMQTSTEFNRFGRSSGIFNSCIYGGVPRGYQQNELEKGVHAVVATPGRLIDFLDSKCTNLNRVTYLVLDEADRMLDMGFEPQIRKIINQIRSDRQTIMCSATWPKEVQALASDFLTRPAHIQIGSSQPTANLNIRQFIEVVEDSGKLALLFRVMKEFIPKGHKIVVFTETKRGCDSLARDLKNERLSAEAIHGDKSQRERDQVLRDFKSSRLNVMVATDVAARGLDVKDVGLVVNFDFPATIEDYIHRVGRTGRAGASGTAISFFTRNNARLAKDLIELLKESKQRVPEGLFKMLNMNGYGQDRRRQFSRSPCRFNR